MEISRSLGVTQPGQGSSVANSNPAPAPVSGVNSTNSESLSNEVSKVTSNVTSLDAESERKEPTQDQIKKDLLAAIEETTGTAFFSLQGKPGTGKTLLLYDMGRTLGAQASTVLIHWGPLQEGHRVINQADRGLTILSTEDLIPEAKAGEGVPADPAGPGSMIDMLSPYSYILVDECHRIPPSLLDCLCTSARQAHQRCIFCLDPAQILTTAEKRNDIAGRIEALPPQGSFTLSERLRGNSELRAFIREVQDLNNKPKIHMSYQNVSLNYAETTAQAQNILDWYRGHGYIFINYTRPRYAESPYAQYEGDYDTDHVAGQEFDRVVMLMDASFYYTEDGRLEGVPHPDPDYLYPNLFYQGITRVREQLALIVVDNPQLFDRIAEIVKE